jgi:hypothetical protein
MSVAELGTCRPVRALLLRGAKRDALTHEGKSCADCIKPETPESLRKELELILVEPKYLECFLVKTPLVKLKKNHKTQLLFILLFLVIFLTQIVLIIPSKLMQL